MYLKRVFPSALVACIMFLSAATIASAQTTDSRPRQVSTATAILLDGSTQLENEPVITIASATPVTSEQKLTQPLTPLAGPRALPLNQMLLSAIDNRLGARYVYGAAGPYVFDCSGFVWSVFQSAGINFERQSARSLWTRFAPAREDEKYKFGTLVFFNNLAHIGIVADEHGFYHASRSHGVTYSPFNDYWNERIDGFRRVPLTTQNFAE